MISERKVSKVTCFAMVSKCELTEVSRFTWIYEHGMPKVALFASILEGKLAEVSHLPMISEDNVIK